MSQKTLRFWEIDLLRGIAVVLMIIYHIMFDLTFLNILIFPLHSIPFRLFLYPIGSLFLLLVGISLVLSYQRYKNKTNIDPPFTKYLKRGLFLFFLALIITLLTWIYPHNGFIVFGVIHCISISIILSYWFIPHPDISLPMGVILISIGIFLTTITTKNPYLFWIGLTTSSFYTLDYFPLLPWLGVVLIGIFLGQHFYPRLAKENITFQKPPKIARPITFLGEHALIIYLLHQPILFGLLYFFFK